MPNTIAENLQRLVDAKADIASAITAKGGTVNTGDGFEEFPADIASIPSGGGSAELASLIDGSIESITIPDGITSIRPGAFQNCASLVTVTIPDSVKTIGLAGFSACYNLENVTIGNGVTDIGIQAFADCSGLDSVIIPNSVEHIASNAFSRDYSLQTITVNKPENSISGAPWGAPSATVVWTG